MSLLSALFSIILIDLVLSGDNAIVIGMAAAALPERQRRLAIVCGVGAALALRVALTLIAALLLTLPYLHLVGGVLLLWIAFRLLQVEEEAAHSKKVPSTFSGAMFTIVVADFIMSLDNVLGVAGASNGNAVLLLIGLGLSMTLMALAGSLVAALLTRFWWLSYVGAAVIAWVGAEMVLRDPVLAGHLGDLEGSPLLAYGVPAITALVTVLASHVASRRAAPAAEDAPSAA